MQQCVNTQLRGLIVTKSAGWDAREKNKKKEKDRKERNNKQKKKKEVMLRRGGRREGGRNRSVVTKALKLPGDGGGHGELRHQS